MAYTKWEAQKLYTTEGKKAKTKQHVHNITHTSIDSFTSLWKEHVTDNYSSYKVFKSIPFNCSNLNENKFNSIEASCKAITTKPSKTHIQLQCSHMKLQPCICLWFILVKFHYLSLLPDANYGTGHCHFICQQLYLNSYLWILTWNSVILERTFW